jgi:hypothetical protein
MIYPQSTLEEIIDSERVMLVDALKRDGKHYKHARNATVYLTLCIASIELDRADNCPPSTPLRQWAVFA